MLWWWVDGWVSFTHTVLMPLGHKGGRVGSFKEGGVGGCCGGWVGGGWGAVGGWVDRWVGWWAKAGGGLPTAQRSSYRSAVFLPLSLPIQLTGWCLGEGG